MTQLIAQSPVFYAGRTRRKGEVFDATAAHAAVLLKTRQVKVCEATAEPDPVEVAPVSRQRRQYRRRDLQAEA